jgi:predicted dehydrogenase/spore coat polysaccharide biosynthesis protein SpsF (cytidylyltransferase family)
MLDRLKLAKRVDQIIVCTSTNPQDDQLVELAESEGVSWFRGDEDDVVKRLADAATAFNLDYILSITADCPFSDPDYADKIVEAYLETNADLIRALNLPHGAFSYGVKPDAFRRIVEIKDQTNTEVWGRYFTDTDLFDVYDLPITNELHRQPGLRMTLDYPADLEFFKAVFAQLYRPGMVFTLDEILHFLRDHKEVVEINRDCAAPFLKRWLSQSSIKLKSRYEVKRAVVIGSGSIGQRHIRNLHDLGMTDIFALRTRQGASKDLDPDLEVKELSDWSELPGLKPDVAIVSNPTSLHLETIERCLPQVRGLFIEKPLAASLDGVAELLKQIKQRRIVSFVGYNLQFHPVVKALQKFLSDDAVGKPLLFQCQVGQWIEDWHPNEDYARAYFARKELGGGVLLTLIHEIHLAMELLGAAEKVTCILPSYETLSVDVEVVADLMIHHSSNAVSQIHLDMIQRPAHRQGVISCERGWISYNFLTNSVSAQTADQTGPVTIWNDPGYDANAPYLEEMATFLNCVREGKVRHEHDAVHATQSLAIATSAFAAARTNSFVEIPDWVRAL